MKLDNFYSVGIVQGRLTKSLNNQLQCFPTLNWEKEFDYAKNLKLSFIELLSERKHNPDNPIWSANGRYKLNDAIKKNKINIYTACSDYILDHNLLKSEKSVEYLMNFFNILSSLNCKKIILPLMESNLITEKNYIDYSFLLRDIQKEAAKRNIDILLESLLPYSLFLKFMEKIGSPIKCVFDTGNIINKIDCIYSEIYNLRDYLEHVHIKDKFVNMKSCMLGKGIVDFTKVFKALKTIEYKNALVLETPRGDDPIETCKMNLKFIKNKILEV